MKKTMLTSFTDGTFNPENIIISKPKEYTVAGGNLKYKMADISIRNPDGTTGSFVVSTEKIFSYGIQENINPVSKEVNGYQMCLNLWSREGPTLAEKTWTDTFNNTIDYIKNYIVENNTDLMVYDIEDVIYLKKFNPLYYKKDKVTKKPDLTAPPVLYAKLATKKAKDSDGKLTGEPDIICTTFTDIETGELIEPEQMMNKKCNVYGGIRFGALYIGASDKISLQLKLSEACVQPLSGGMQRLIFPPKDEESKETGRFVAEDDIDFFKTSSVEATKPALTRPQVAPQQDISESEEEEEVVLIKKPAAPTPARKPVVRKK